MKIAELKAWNTKRKTTNDVWKSLSADEKRYVLRSRKDVKAFVEFSTKRNASPSVDLRDIVGKHLSDAWDAHRSEG